jgi:glycosyltransferase involved in cell wall biosynthesis
MKNKSILHCIATMQGGGAEKQVCLLVEALVKKDWIVHVALLKRGVNFARLQKTGAFIHEIKIKSFKNPLIIYRLIKLLHLIKPDIIQFWQRPFDVFGPLAAMRCGCSFISVERTSPYLNQNSLKGILRLLIVQFSNGLVSNSIDGKNYWDQRLIRNIPNLIIPNILSYDELNTYKKKPEREYIIAVGRISKEKNVYTLIQAMVNIKKIHKHILLYILGEGEDKELLQNFTIIKGLENNIKFLGYKTDVGHWVKNAKLFVSLSLFEGMPNAVLEAAALSTPMLLSDIPPHRFNFSEGSAFFTTPNDVEEVAANVINIFDHYDIAIKKAVNAFEAVQNNSGDFIAEQYINLYERCIV